MVKEAIAAGVDGYDADIKQAVRKAAHGLRLTREAAMSIASKAVSIEFIFVLIGIINLNSVSSNHLLDLRRSGRFLSTI